jgi:hypothetical protein
VCATNQANPAAQPACTAIMAFTRTRKDRA